MVLKSILHLEALIWQAATEPRETDSYNEQMYCLDNQLRNFTRQHGYMEHLRLHRMAGWTGGLNLTDQNVWTKTLQAPRDPAEDLEYWENLGREFAQRRQADNDTVGFVDPPVEGATNDAEPQLEAPTGPSSPSPESQANETDALSPSQLQLDPLNRPITIPRDLAQWMPDFRTDDAQWLNFVLAHQKPILHGLAAHHRARLL